MRVPPLVCNIVLAFCSPSGKIARALPVSFFAGDSMGFSLTQPQEACEINGVKFTVDPFEEFDVITALEAESNGDITLRDAAYKKRITTKYELSALSEVACQAFMNWIVAYCQDFLESDKKKRFAPAE